MLKIMQEVAGVGYEKIIRLVLIYYMQNKFMDT
jgi:hypothetical protein